MDAHSDFQTDQVATYDHSHVWSAQEAFALFLLLIPAAVAQGPWRVIYTKAKKGDQPCSEHGTAAASVDRGDGVDVKDKSLKDYIAELKDELEDAEERLRELETREQGESRRSANT